MNFLQHIYPGDAVASFVIRVLAEITLVTAVAFLLARLIARKNAAMRHGICVCALFCVVVAPLTTLGLQRLGWSTFSIRLESEKQVAIAVPYGETVVPASVIVDQPFWTLERARDAASLIILIWALGAGVLLFRLGNGSRKVRSLRKSVREIDDPKLRAALDSIGFPTRAPVRFSRRLHSPVVVGPRQTTVILPEKLLGQLDEEQLRCVLAHELTHVRQRDPLIGLIQRLVEAGYWPHPMVHVLNRDLVRAREEVCDNAALNGTSAPQYADTLLTVALGMSSRQATFGVGLMTNKWRLEERVKGLLDPQRRLTTTMNTRHLAYVLVALAAGTAFIAGAQVVASPNPPNPQQALDLYTHYNPKTKKVTVTSKFTSSKTAKAVKVSVKPSGKQGKWTVTGSNSKLTISTNGKSYTVHATPTVVQEKTVRNPSKDSLYYVYTNSDKGRPHKGIKVETIDGKSDFVTVYGNTTVANTGSGAIVKLSGSDVDVAKGLTVITGHPNEQTGVYEIHTNSGNVKASGEPVIIDTTKQVGDTVITSQDGQTKTVTATGSGLTVIPDVQIRNEVKDKRDSVVLDLRGLTIKGSPIEKSRDTIVLGTKDGLIYVQPQGADKAPTVRYVLPRSKMDLKELPEVRIYSTPVQQLRPKVIELHESPGRIYFATPQFKTIHGLDLKNYTVGAHGQFKTIEQWMKPKSNPTTVYIDGDHIKVVGDNIKVVHVDSKSKKGTKSGSK